MTLYNQFQYSLVGAYQAVSARPAGGTLITNQNLPAGTIAMVGPDHKVLTTLPSTGKVKFVLGMGANKELVSTPWMDVTKLTIKGQKYVAPAQEVLAIGYQGTGTDNLPAANGTQYRILINKRDNNGANNHSFFPDIIGTFKTDASGSPYEFARDGATSIAYNAKAQVNSMNVDGPAYLRPRVVSDGSASALGNSATLSVKYFSKMVTASDAGHNLTAGDYVTIGDGTTIYDVYKVEDVNGVNITLDRIYTGPTADGVSGAEVSGPTLWGIHLTGLPEAFDVYNFRDYMVNTFDAVVKKGDVKDPTIKTAIITQPFAGIGTWQEVSYKEFESFGFLGNKTQIARATPGLNVRPQTVVEGANYSAIIITEEKETPKYFVGDTAKVKYQVNLFLQLSGSNKLDSGSQGDQLATTLISGFTTGDLDA